jgi:hypothetical protein
MNHRVFSGPRGLGGDFSPRQATHAVKEFETLDAGLGWARNLADNERVALLIEGHDGTWLGKEEISAVGKAS